MSISEVMHASSLGVFQDCNPLNRKKYSTKRQIIISIKREQAPQQWMQELDYIHFLQICNSSTPYIYYASPNTILKGYSIEMVLWWEIWLNHYIGKLRGPWNGWWVVCHLGHTQKSFQQVSRIEGWLNNRYWNNSWLFTKLKIVYEIAHQNWTMLNGNYVFFIWGNAQTW